MAMTEIVCNSKTAAVTALEIIAGLLPRGTQRETVIAITKWIDENYPKDFDDATKERIRRIYDRYAGDEHANAAIEWQVHGGEPPHGTRAEVPFLFNAETKTWELEGEMPPIWTEPNPDILPKEEGIETDGGG